MKVLVIEDDADVAELVSLCIGFQWPDANIIRAAEGQEGLSLAETERPDLVLLDILLPDVNGLMVLKRFRDFSDAPVIVLTALDRDVDVALFLTEGADDYVAKPFSQIELIARIEAVMRRAVGRQLLTEEVPQAKRAVDRSVKGADSAPSKAKAPKRRAASKAAAQRPAEEQITYEGSVRLIVETKGEMRQMVSFVQEVRARPELRVLRLADNHTGSVDIWVRIRRPVSLRSVLSEMEGVVDVSPTPVRDLTPEGDSPTIRVTLGAVKSRSKPS